MVGRNMSSGNKIPPWLVGRSGRYGPWLRLAGRSILARTQNCEGELPAFSPARGRWESGPAPAWTRTGPCTCEFLVGVVGAARDLRPAVGARRRQLLERLLHQRGAVLVAQVHRDQTDRACGPAPGSAGGPGAPSPAWGGSAGPWPRLPSPPSPLAARRRACRPASAAARSRCRARAVRWCWSGSRRGRARRSGSAPLARGGATARGLRRRWGRVRRGRGLSSRPAAKLGSPVLRTRRGRERPRARGSEHGKAPPGT
jgi:hypothetical protein